MATRCLILKKEKGLLEGIYCHNDGYPEFMESMLKENYSEIEEIKNLFELGNISMLGVDVKQTLAFCRDRDEEFENIELSTIEEIEELDLAQEYVYIFDNGVWKYSDDRENLRNLKIL